MFEFDCLNNSRVKRIVFFFLFCRMTSFASLGSLLLLVIIILSRADLPDNSCPFNISSDAFEVLEIKLQALIHEGDLKRAFDCGLILSQASSLKGVYVCGWL